MEGRSLASLAYAFLLRMGKIHNRALTSEDNKKKIELEDGILPGSSFVCKISAFSF